MLNRTVGYDGHGEIWKPQTPRGYRKTEITYAFPTGEFFDLSPSCINMLDAVVMRNINECAMYGFLPVF